MGPEICRLADLRVGQRGKIRLPEAVPAAADRLFAMGLLPGTEVKMVQVAPLGDPVEIEFRGMRLSLRKGDAGALHVERVPDV